MKSVAKADIASAVPVIGSPAPVDRLQVVSGKLNFVIEQLGQARLRQSGRGMPKMDATRDGDADSLLAQIEARLEVAERLARDLNPGGWAQ